MKLFLSILFVFGFTWYGRCQSPPSSAQPAKAFNDYCDKIYRTQPLKTIDVAKIALKKATDENNALEMARAYEMTGVAFDYLGRFDTALVYFDSASTILGSDNNNYYRGRIMKSKANSLFSLSRFDESLRYYLDAYDLAIQRHDEKEAATLLMGIGNVYNQMKLYNKALKYYFDALEIENHLHDSTMISYLYTNISETYTTLGNKGEEYLYLKKSLQLKEQLNDEYGLVFSYSNMCRVMAEYGEQDSALYFGRKGFALARKIDNVDFMAAVANTLGWAFMQFSQNDSARFYVQKSVDLSVSTGNLPREYEALKTLADIYEKQQHYEQALKSLKRFLVLNDTLFNRDMRKSLNELHTKYETEKVEKENLLLTERDKKKQVVLYAVVCGLLLLALLSLVLFNRNRLKQRTAVALQKQNAEIEQQKKTIEQKQKEILDSIYYAQRIQKAQLASSQLLRRNLGGHFILYKPKDIVSGDFYWAHENPHGFYLCVADSTGHGVPGAFMSLLNISYLNEAIVEKQITEPNKILQYVSQRLAQAMYLEDTGESGKDGMDCVLFRIEKQKGKISFAAANNPVWVYDKKMSAITVYKPDKLPVGKGEKEVSDFALHETLIAEKTFYAFTDGYADQFGGPSGKKFKYSNLMQLIQTNGNLPYHEQEALLKHHISTWTGELEQVDDILVLGFEV